MRLTSRLASWIGASIMMTALLSAVRCSPPPPTACVPSCREGFTCVAATCVSACNPLCSSGERCDTSGGRARCVAADGGASDGSLDRDGDHDADATIDAGLTDGGSIIDSNTIDSSTIDSSTIDSSTIDSSTIDSNTIDGATMDSGTRPPCGMPGQPCCERYCQYGSTCETVTGESSGTCRAFAPVMGECVGPTTCAMPNARCRVGLTCGERRCIQCVANPVTATRRIGEPCANTDECETGFCFGGKCSTLCNLGPAGDAACAAMLPGGLCGGGTSSLSLAPDGGPARTSILSFGACRRGCARDADCVMGDVCAPATNEGLDRLDFVCRTPSMGGLSGGAACTMNSQCASGVCLPLGGPTNVCFRACRSNADCPASAPMCVEMSWLRPSGGLQPGRACAPR